MSINPAAAGGLPPPSGLPSSSWEEPPVFADAPPEERPGRARRTLAALAGVSLFGHALGFYVLQAFYTPAGTLPPAPPPARWTLVPAGTPESAALARWLTLADPALGAGAVAPRPERVLAHLPPVPYVPSFQAAPPAALAGGWLETFGDDPPPLQSSSAGSAFPPAPVLPSIRHAEPAATPVPIPARTRVFLPEPLRRRLPGGEAPPPGPSLVLPGTATLAELPRPVTFLIGVRPEGGPPLVFREAPSGVTAADEAARVHLESLPFTPAGNDAPMVWGRVTVRWGGAALRAE